MIDSQHNVEQFYESAPNISDSSTSAKGNSETPRVDVTSNSPQKDDISIPFVSTEGTANRVIINVTFNGRVTAPILVDTGSPGLMISASLADQLGLFSKDSSSLMVLVSGIGGTQKALRTIVDKITIGSIQEKFIPTHIVADMSDAYEGLIGMDILSNYTLTIDSSKNRLIANLNPSAKDLPGGRNRSWWENTFREFGAYRDLLDTHADLAAHNKYPYSNWLMAGVRSIKSFFCLPGEKPDLCSKNYKIMLVGTRCQPIGGNKSPLTRCLGLLDRMCQE